MARNKLVTVAVFNNKGKEIGQLKGKAIDVAGIPCIVHKGKRPLNEIEGYYVTCQGAGMAMMGFLGPGESEEDAVAIALRNIETYGVERVREMIATRRSEQGRTDSQP